MGFIDVPLRTVRFHGPMIALFGREFTYRAPTVPKAIEAMKNLIPGFERYLLDAHKKGLTFAVFVGKRNVPADEMAFTHGSDTIHLVPIIMGSKAGGLFQTILGVALVAVGYFTFGTTSAVGVSMMLSGGAMALGGVVQMLSPQMGGLRMREDPDNKPSYAFGGPVNSTAQGNPVGVLYGTREIGGPVISAGIYAEDQQ
ncbi:tail assembly protein [Serratia marcescens]|nr:tail assembly protein [Serratia marcescens]